MYTIITETAETEDESIPEDFTGLATTEAGNKFWVKDGEHHREGDEPATIYPNGSKLWYKYGIAHREKGLPVEIWTNGTKYWYISYILTGKFYSQ